MKRGILSVLLVVLLLTLVACGQKKSENSFEKLTFQAEDGSEVVVDETIDYAIVLMVTINPEALFYVDSNKNVLKIEALNSDCEDVLASMNCKTGNFVDCYGDFLEICYRQGYLKADNKQEVKLTAIALGDNSSEAVGRDVVANAEELVGGISDIYGMDLYATKDTRALEPVSTPAQVGSNEEEHPADAPNQAENQPENNQQENNQPENNQPEDTTCDLCNGVGVLNCESCNGTKTEMVIEHFTKEVRNDYVCPVCGGKGWVDDGMHGGLTAECGHCTTNGGNGEFKALAYDRVEVDEEVVRPCHQCGGTGRYICNRCDGSGKR